MQRKTDITSFIRLIPTFLPFIPNHDQLAAIEKISKFIFTSDERAVFILKGYAGTGKTNLISAITKGLPEIKWRSVLLAPTGRAAKVLSAYSHKQAFTIHGVSVAAFFIRHSTFWSHWLASAPQLNQPHIPCPTSLSPKVKNFSQTTPPKKA
jgi:RecG-like helicase